MVNSEYSFPIAETFLSIQGEGGNIGKLTRFWRLAGCNVGVYSKPESMSDGPLRIFREQNPKYAICTTALGESFGCDTNYLKVFSKNINEIVAHSDDAVNMCLTGGEPLIHTHLQELIRAFVRNGKVVSLETSGTLPLSNIKSAWVTCPPKAGYLPENTEYVDEFKFVITADADVYETIKKIDNMLIPTNKVYLSPANGIKTVDKTSLLKVLEILKVRKTWRLTPQLHKLLDLD